MELITFYLIDKATPVLQVEITPKYSKVTSAIWGPLEDFIVTGHETGDLISWDMRVSYLT